MDWIIPLLSVAGGILIGAMSPGPSFIVVARASIATSKLGGLATAFGMGLAGAVFASAAVLGLVVLLGSVPILFIILKLLGATYLFLSCLQNVELGKQTLRNTSFQHHAEFLSAEISWHWLHHRNQ